MSKRESIVAAITTKLGTIPGITSFRSHVEPFARGQLPAVVVMPSEEVSDNSTLYKMDWLMTLDLTIYINSDTPDMAGDPFISEVYSKMMEDQSLGGLTMDIQPFSVNYNIIESNIATGMITLKFKVQYRTDALNLN